MKDRLAEIRNVHQHRAYQHVLDKDTGIVRYFTQKDLQYPVEDDILVIRSWILIEATNQMHGYEASSR